MQKLKNILSEIDDLCKSGDANADFIPVSYRLLDAIHQYEVETGFESQFEIEFRDWVMDYASKLIK